MTINSKLPALLGLLLCASSVFGSELAVSEIEELTVVGSRLNDASSGFESTITEETLEALAPISVQDALRSLPGVFLSQPGGRSGVPSLSIRGAESNFALVLVDGVRVNDPNNTRGGSFDFSTLDVAEITTMQLVRGPASAVYGSDAMAGVLNVRTFDRQSDSRLSVDAADDEMRRYSLRLNQELTDELYANATLSRSSEEYAGGASFDGDFARVNLVSESTGLEWSLSAAFAETEQRAFPEDSGGDRFAAQSALDRRDSESLTLNGSLRYALTENLALVTRASWLDREEDFRSPGILPGPRSDFGVPPNEAVSDLERIEVTSFVTGDYGRVNWVTGLDWRQEDGASVGEVTFLGPTAFEIDRDQLGVFGELSFAVSDRLTLEGSLRSDSTDDEGEQTTYGFAATYAVADRTSLIARTGTGFKLPSFFALASPLVGNPALEAETVRNWEVGVAHSTDSLSVQLVYFDSAYKDLVDFDSELFTNVNRSQVDTSGVDLSVQGSVDRLNLGYRALLSYVDVDAPNPLRQRPDWRYGFDLFWSPTDRWSFTGSVNYTGDRFDSSIPRPSVTLDSYLRTDVLASYSLTDRLKISIGALNLFDEAFEDADGFTGQGRQVRARMQWSF
ncbi:MAG: TonB-dependent receptor [Pseudomonadota bacterium]